MNFFYAKKNMSRELFKMFHMTVCKPASTLININDKFMLNDRVDKKKKKSSTEVELEGQFVSHIPTLASNKKSS